MSQKHSITLLIVSLISAPTAYASFSVTATVETKPVPSSGDAADDNTIWVHPSDPAQSVVIGTNKQGGLGVYNLDGTEVQYRADGRMNNVDVRYNFSLGGQQVALVGASNRTSNSIALYRMNPSTRTLEPVAARTITVGVAAIYGFAMYRSRVSGKTYAFICDKDTGVVEQWELYDNGTGKVDGKRVRSIDIGSQSEGIVADDELGHLYVAEEDVGIWKYGAEPGATSARVSVDRVGDHLTADVEGLAIYYGKNGTGYLLASNQGASRYNIYERQNDNRFIDTFSIVNGSIDGTNDTDGIDVTNFGLGSLFPKGVFIAQDGANDKGYQNYKLVPWEKIAQGAGSLLIDSTYDPRIVLGGGGGGTAPSPSPTPTTGPAPSPTSTSSPTPPPSSTPPLSSGANLLKNPGFESGKTDWRIDWGYDVIATKGAFAGNYALRIGMGAGGRAQDVKPSGVAGKTYVLKAAGKMSLSGDIGQIGVHMLAGSTKKSETSLEFKSGSWETKSLSFTVPAGVDTLRVFVKKPSSSGYIYADEVSLAEADGSASPTPTPPLAPTPSPTSTSSPVLSTKSFTAVADATLRSNDPLTNYSTQPVLEVDYSPSVEALVAFNVSGVSGTVKSARLRVYASNGSSNGPAVYASVSGWNKSSINWDTRPARISGALEDKGSISKGSWVEYNVLSAIKGDGTYSFTFAGTSTDGVDFHSSEGSNKPQLILSFESGGGSSPTPAPSVTPVPSPSSSPTTGPISGDPTASYSMTPIYQDIQTINGVAYSVHSALKEHSIRKSSNGGVYDFEVHEGEARIGKDPTQDRSELHGGTQLQFAPNSDIWVAYSFMLEKGTSFSDISTNFGQMHGGIGSPPMSFKIPDDNTLQVRVISGSSSNSTKSYPYTMNNFQRGKWYSIVLHTKFNPSGGLIQLWIDGVKVLDKPNIPMGYTDSDDYYWKFGIYREKSPVVMSARYANMELSGSSLLHRVTNPKPIAP